MVCYECHLEARYTNRLIVHLYADIYYLNGNQTNPAHKNECTEAQKEDVNTYINDYELKPIKYTKNYNY